MASRIRKLASETAVYGVSSVLGRAVNFLLFPFYSNVFAPEVYGPIVVVYAAFIFLNILYQYGLESAYLKFASDAGDGRGRNRVFSTATWSLVATAGLFSSLLWLFSGGIAPAIGLSPDDAFLLEMAAAILFVDTVIVVPYAQLRLAGRPWYFATVRLASVAVNIAANLLLILGAGMGIEAILLANIASSNTALMLLLPVFARHLRRVFDSALWREMVRFALPFVPGGLGYALTERVNIFFLERMDPARVLALYGDAMPESTVRAITDGNVSAATDFVVGAYGGIVKLAVLGALAVQMFRYAWQPFFLQHARDDDARPLFARVFVLLTAGVFGVVLLVSLLADELVAIPLPGGRNLIAQSYWVGLSVVPIVLVGYAFQGWYYMFSAGAYIEKQTRYFVHCTLAGAAVAVGINAVFVPEFGMVAAAWATTASYVVMALTLFGIVRRFYPVPYPWLRVLPVAGAALLGLLAWSLVPVLQTAWGELAVFVVFAGIATVTLRPLLRPRMPSD